MQIKKEMALTYSEFFRLLPRAMGENLYEIEGNVVSCQLPTGSLKITLGIQQTRKLVLVCIPFIEITFDYIGVEEVDRLAFIKYFDLRFMRGLG